MAITIKTVDEMVKLLNGIAIVEIDEDAVRNQFIVVDSEEEGIQRGYCRFLLDEKPKPFLKVARIKDLQPAPPGRYECDVSNEEYAANLDAQLNDWVAVDREGEPRDITFHSGLSAEQALCILWDMEREFDLE